MAAEEFLEELTAFFGEHPGSNFRAVVQAWVTQQVPNRPRHPGFFIPRAEHDSLHARKDDRARAHRARLERYVEGAVVEAPPIQLRCRFADREQLGVPGGVLITDGPITRRGDNRSVPYYNRADWNFVAQRRVAGEIESVSNVLLVGSESRCAGAERLRACGLICLQALALSLS